MTIFQLSNDTRFVDVDLGATGLSIAAMALETMGLGDTALTSVSTPDIQELGSDIYRITFTAEQVNEQGFLLFSLTGTGFDPFIGLLYTVSETAAGDPISGTPLGKEAFLPVVAFSGVTPITGLTDTDFNTFFTKSDKVIEETKTLVSGDVIEPLNEFSTARGIYLVKFSAAELSRIGDFDYRSTTTGATAFDPFATSIQVTEGAKVTTTLEVRDSSPDLITPTPKVPEGNDLTVFIETSSPVNRLSFRFSQFGVGYVGLTFEYFNGTVFTTLTVTDGTSDLSQNGDVVWTLPLDQSTGGPGTPNQTGYFIKISATAVTTDAILEKVDAEVVVSGVTLTVLDSDADTIDSGITSDLGQLVVKLSAGDYTVTLQKDSDIFNQNNVKLTILDEEGLAALGITDMTQKIVLEGARLSLADPVVDPTLITLKADIVNLSGNPVQRQEIRLEHKFLPVLQSGSKAVLGRTVNLITDDRGHAELEVIADSQIDVFVTNTTVNRQIKAPLPRSGTGDTVGTPPTPSFKSDGTEFLATDVNAIITINGIDHVITKVEDSSNIEVSPNFTGALVTTAWSIKKVDIFSLIGVAPDQFQVAVPTFDDFAVRTTLP